MSAVPRVPPIPAPDISDNITTPELPKMNRYLRWFIGIIVIILLCSIVLGLLFTFIDWLGALLLTIAFGLFLMYFVFTDTGKNLWKGITKTRLGLTISIGILLTGTFIIWGVVNQKATYDFTLALFLAHITMFGILWMLINLVPWQTPQEYLRRFKRRLRKVKTIPPDEILQNYNRILDSVENKMVTEPDVFDNIGSLTGEDLNKVQSLKSDLEEIINTRRNNPTLFAQEKRPNINTYNEIFGSGSR